VTRTKIQRIMAEVKSFPGMPATAAKLLSLLDNPDSSAAQIADILRYDPGLTANILKLTNSAYFGIPSTVSSVKQAIMLLGWKRIMQLVTTICIKSVMKKPVPGYRLNPGELWRHSIAVSIAAEVLVRFLKIREADEVFTAALLHDVGKLVLSNFVKEDIAQIEDMVAKGITFDVAEYMILGTDHAEIGANILRDWSLPSDLVNAVNWHHHPETCENGCTLSDIVHVANNVGLMVGFADARAAIQIDPSPAVIERLGLTRTDLSQMATETADGVDKLMDVIGPL
jgi:putative nucleotidyltransferase with HDIG domain